jgi:hypothetical protein
MGEAREDATNRTLSSGYALMPASMNHWAYAGLAATIVLYGQGPSAHVNPSDDPGTNSPLLFAVVAHGQMVRAEERPIDP